MPNFRYRALTQNGEIVQEATPRELYENPATRKQVIGLRVDNTKRPTK